MSRPVAALTEQQKEERRAKDRARSARRAYANLTLEQIERARAARRAHRSGITEEQRGKEREWYRARYQRDKEKILTRGDAYRENNRKAINARQRLRWGTKRGREARQRRTEEQQRKYRANATTARLANKEATNTKNREWRRNNPDKVRIAKKKDYEKHRSNILAADRQRRLDNLELYRERDRLRGASAAKREQRKRSALKNPDTVRTGWSNRRARVKGAEGRHSPQDVRELFINQSGACAGCGCFISKTGNAKYHIDHKVPLKRGGTNWPHNLQLLCRHCNQVKGHSDFQKWLTVIRPRLISERSFV